MTETGTQTSMTLKIKLSLLAKAILYILNYLDIENNVLSNRLKEIYSHSDDLNFPDWTRYYEEKFDHSEFILILKELIFDDFNLKVEDIGITLDVDSFFKNFTKHTKEFEDFPITKEKAIKAKSMAKSGKLNPLLKAYAVFVYFLCPALFEDRLDSLLRKGKSGNREAILKLIQVDKTLIGKSWVINEIRKAQVLQEQEFLNKLATALTENPLATNPEYYRLYIVLGFLWKEGLNNMKVEELWFFCRSLNIYPNDLDAFKKLIYRYKKNL